MDPPADSNSVTRPGAMRAWLLGGFKVSVGPHTIEGGAWRLRKAATLVKLLALARGHRLRREQVMDLLWPDMDRNAASNNLRRTLHSARRALDPSAGYRYVASQDEQLVLCARSELWVDVEAFEEATATARREREPAAYRAAIELYVGDLLPEDRYEEWAEVRRQELRRMFLSLLVELATVLEERAEPAHVEDGEFGIGLATMNPDGSARHHIIHNPGIDKVHHPDWASVR